MQYFISYISLGVQYSDSTFFILPFDHPTNFNDDLSLCTFITILSTVFPFAFFTPLPSRSPLSTISLVYVPVHLFFFVLFY